MEVEEGGTYFAGGGSNIRRMAGFARRSSLKRHLNFMALLGTTAAVIIGCWDDDHEEVYEAAKHTTAYDTIPY